MAVRTRKVAVPAEDYDETGMDEFADKPEDSAPATPVKRSTRVSGNPVSSGWGAPTEERRETVKAPFLDLKNGKLVIKIHDNEPTVNFWQHYVNSQNKYLTCSSEREGSRILSPCPLCDAGHYAGQQFRMNVTDMDAPKEVKTWTFGRMVAGILQGLSEDKALNDSNRYFNVWRTKPSNGGTWTYTILPLKARDLQEDFGLEPLNEDELDTLADGLYGEETVWINTERQLQESADRLTDKDLKKN